MKEYFTIYDKSGYYYNGSQRIGEVAFGSFDNAQHYPTREEAATIAKELSLTYPHTRLVVAHYYEAKESEAFERLVKGLKSKGIQVDVTCNAVAIGGRVHTFTYVARCFTF